MERDYDNAWESTVDNGRFHCWVKQYDDGYTGMLTIEVTETKEVIFSENVGVSYAARFGPDVADVDLWQSMCIERIDAWIAEHPDA